MLKDLKERVIKIRPNDKPFYYYGEDGLLHDANVLVDDELRYASDFTTDKFIKSGVPLPTFKPNDNTSLINDCMVAETTLEQSEAFAQAIGYDTSKPASEQPSIAELSRMRHGDSAPASPGEPLSSDSQPAN